MICPTCRTNGTKSTIDFDGMRHSTAMIAHHFFDENGKEHHHDPNWYTDSLICSNGHLIDRAMKKGCGNCGDDGELEITVKPESEKKSAKPAKKR